MLLSVEGLTADEIADVRGTVDYLVTIQVLIIDIMPRAKNIHNFEINHQKGRESRSFDVFS